MNQHLLFLTLKTFSATGGIEKVSRVAGKALHDICTEWGWTINIFSMYDKQVDNPGKYFPKAVFCGFGGEKTAFVLKSIQRGKQSQVVIISHINLLAVGFAIKKLSPKTKLVLITHGIEVWCPLPEWKKAMLRQCDLLLPVSDFTKTKMTTLYGLTESKLKVVNNCLDPFLPALKTKEKSESLLQRYGLRSEDKILLTLTRLSSTERYKGYDEVLMAVKSLKKEMPHIRYLIVGKYDQEEKIRIDRLVQQQGLQENVVLSGFVSDEELADHFNLADVYVMPSRKEGFGIVFIEALFYGKPVIAGNRDGSVDALAKGALGTLVDPDSTSEIILSLENILKSTRSYIPDQKAVLDRFSFPVYRNMLQQVLREVVPAGRVVNKVKKPANFL